MNKSTELYANTPPIDCVNELYSLNYTLLQLQTGVKSASRGPFVYTREDIFSKSTPAEDFFSEKIELTAEFRNKYIESLVNNFTNVDNGLDDILLNAQKNLAILYELTFFKKKNECKYFSSTHFIPEDFHQAYKLYKNGNRAPFDSIRKPLYEAYENYERFEDNYRWFKTVKELVEALSDDLTAYGYKSLYYNKPTSSNIFKLDRETIEELVAFSKKKQVDAYKYKKKVVKAYKKSNENIEDLPAVNLLESKYSLALQQYIKGLELRLSDANKNLESSSLKRGNLLVNILSGEGFKIYNSKVKIDSIYVHKYEIEDLLELLYFDKEGCILAEKIINKIFPSEKSSNINASENGLG